MDITVLIPARDASATIERALCSIDLEKVYEVILIDDFSSDNTVAIADGVVGKKLKVVRPDKHISVPYARNYGLDAMRTTYGVWLDADDEYLPGRVDRLWNVLQRDNSDVVSDAQELYNGVTNKFLYDLPIPSFISRDADKIRLFERNYLPGIGHVAFRTELAQKVRYDPGQLGGDDSDFIWRMIRAGARFSFVPEKGYRMYAYPGSDSRKLERQRERVAHALKKHDYADIRNAYFAAGFSPEITAWGLCSMAVFREEYDCALTFLEETGACRHPNLILEQDGPFDLPEAWRYYFMRGTLNLQIGKLEEAYECLQSALEIRRSADVLNNLGTTQMRRGHVKYAKQCWQDALAIFPEYLDAKLNLADGVKSRRITSHPLRLQPSRKDYA